MGNWLAEIALNSYVAGIFIVWKIFLQLQHNAK